MKRGERGLPVTACRSELSRIMIAAHAEALGATLVTNSVAIKKLKIDGLRIVGW